jgi:hypothetical protein
MLTRIPVSRLHRAFPQLRAVSDADAAAVVRKATPGMYRALPLWLFVAFYAVFAYAGGINALVGRAIQSGVPAWVRPPLRAFLQYKEIQHATLGVLLLSAALCLLISRDACVRRNLRSLARRAACPACARVLIGAPRDAVGVRCTACDMTIGYGVLGVTPPEIGAPVVVLVRTPWCPSCAYSLHGVPISNDQITCPECGSVVASTEERQL